MSARRNGLSDLVRAELSEARDTIERLLQDDQTLRSIEDAAELLASVLAEGGKILLCGNGGSLCDAMHFAAELTGRYRHPRRPLAALALVDAAHLSCVANDESFEQVFARQVYALGRPGDALVTLSTSGHSANLLEAAVAARESGLVVLALTGRGGGALGPLADLELQAPDTRHADRAQEIHIKILHTLVAAIELILRSGDDGDSRSGSTQIQRDPA